MTQSADGHRRVAQAIGVCGGTIALAMVALAFVDARDRPAVFVAWALLAGAAYLVALGLLGRLRPGNTRALALCLVLAAVWRIPLVATPPRLSTDVYRYVWDGRLQRLGEDPYRVVPDDPAVAHLHTPVTRQLNNGWVPTIYPPGAELFFRAVSAVEESARAMKGAFVLCDGLVVLVVLRLLAVAGLSPWWVLAYAWNPLVALEGAGNGHVDLLGTLAVATTAWAVVRKRRTVAALYVPFVREGVLPLGSLGAYLAEWRFNGPLFAALVPHVSPTMLAGLGVLAGLAIAAWARTRFPDDPAAWAWPVATALTLAPSVYPWYLLWLTPFLFGPLTRPLAVWTVAILPTYVALHLEDLHGTLGLPWWLVTAEYGAVIVALAVTVIARVRLREPSARLEAALAERDG